MTGVSTFSEHFFLQLPTFDDQGYYVGPLPRRESTTSLARKSNLGFAATGTEQWPSEMRKWIASSILAIGVQEADSYGG